jgi:hypothetical protein
LQRRGARRGFGPGTCTLWPSEARAEEWACDGWVTRAPRRGKRRSIRSARAAEHSAATPAMAVCGRTKQRLRASRRRKSRRALSRRPPARRTPAQAKRERDVRFWKPHRVISDGCSEKKGRSEGKTLNRGLRPGLNLSNPWRRPYIKTPTHRSGGLVVGIQEVRRSGVVRHSVREVNALHQDG